MTASFLSQGVQESARLAQTASGLAGALDERMAAGYRSRFTNWDTSASVRSRPRRVVADGAADDQLYFPPELVPCFDHPLVRAAGTDARRRLLIRSLYNYLHFTAELESLAVIPVATELARGRAGFFLSAAARQDAYRIVTDEAWHAQFSDDLSRQVEAQTGETLPLLPAPQFVDRLTGIADRLHTNVPALGRLLFAVVSETLVSSLLARIPHDQRLPAAVRDTVADHAMDEGRHHAYFRDVLGVVWHALTPAERRSVGPWLPSIILAFLEPDYRAVGQALDGIGLTTEQIEAVLVESYPRQQVLARSAEAAQSTIRYFREVGALDDPATADAFGALLAA
ncbi:diiron oxygenase [Catellatospora tritici]|uniref:diiron oxygenase n=1 Tax=Catellatospora tritici TaxID=2851566 RepID=UPI001C2DB71E|nr:diiron oxygenase [Catellatospora tritici]MBV1849550.1 diiron oxygenase [Catellatospora tritici]